MAKTLIYHNPRCSKSRQTLALLEENDVQPEIIRYLENPPSEQELRNLLELLGLSPMDLMRQKEAEFKAQQLNDPSLSDDDLIQAMIATPKLIERPIVVRGKKAVIGRPPENVLEII